MTFYGESIGLYDAISVAGQDVWTAPVVDGVEQPTIYNGIYRQDDDLAAQIQPGDDFILVVSSGDTNYLESSDLVGQVRWVLTASGTGTLEVYDGHDPDWSYDVPAYQAMMSTPLATLSIVAGQPTEYVAETSADLHNPVLLSGSLNGGEALLLRIKCTAGPVTLTGMRLQMEPVGGVAGRWSDPVTPPSQAAYTTFYSHKQTVSGTATSTTGYPFQAAVEAARVDPTAQQNYVSYLNRDDTTGALSSTAPSPLVNFGYSGATTKSTTVTLEQGVVIFRLGYPLTAPNNMQTWPGIEFKEDGVTRIQDGVDYIRRPDRTPQDNFAYVLIDPSHPTADLLGWYQIQVTVNRYDTGTQPHKITVEALPFRLPTTTNEFGQLYSSDPWNTAVGTKIAEVTVAAGATSAPIVLPPPDTPDGYTLLVRTDLVHDGNVITTGIAPAGWSNDNRVQTTVTLTMTPTGEDLGSSSYAAYVQPPNFQYWIPEAGAGGLPTGVPRVEVDGQWRRVGYMDPTHEGQSPSGRLKIDVDEGWRQERMPYDGSTGHPLKMMTDEGWKVIACMVEPNDLLGVPSVLDPTNVRSYTATQPRQGYITGAFPIDDTAHAMFVWQSMSDDYTVNTYRPWILIWENGTCTGVLPIQGDGADGEAFWNQGYWGAGQWTYVRPGRYVYWTPGNGTLSQIVVTRTSATYSTVTGLAKPDYLHNPNVASGFHALCRVSDTKVMATEATYVETSGGSNDVTGFTALLNLPVDGAPSVTVIPLDPGDDAVMLGKILPLSDSLVAVVRHRTVRRPGDGHWALDTSTGTVRVGLTGLLASEVGVYDISQNTLNLVSVHPGLGPSTLATSIYSEADRVTRLGDNCGVLVCNDSGHIDQKNIYGLTRIPTVYLLPYWYDPQSGLEIGLPMQTTSTPMAKWFLDADYYLSGFGNRALGTFMERINTGVGDKPRLTMFQFEVDPLTRTFTRSDYSSVTFYDTTSTYGPTAAGSVNASDSIGAINVYRTSDSDTQAFAKPLTWQASGPVTEDSLMVPTVHNAAHFHLSEVGQTDTATPPRCTIDPTTLGFPLKYGPLGEPIGDGSFYYEITDQGATDFTQDWVVVDIARWAPPPGKTLVGAEMRFDLTWTGTPDGDGLAPVQWRLLSSDGREFNPGDQSGLRVASGARSYLTAPVDLDTSSDGYLDGTQDLLDLLANSDQRNSAPGSSGSTLQLWVRAGTNGACRIGMAQMLLAVR